MNLKCCQSFPHLAFLFFPISLFLGCFLYIFKPLAILTSANICQILSIHDNCYWFFLSNLITDSFQIVLTRSRWRTVIADNREHLGHKTYICWDGSDLKVTSLDSSFHVTRKYYVKRQRKESVKQFWQTATCMNYNNYQHSKVFGNA